MSGLIVCGDNMGLKTIYEGLVSCFDRIEVYTNTPDVIALRECDSFINGFDCSDAQYVLSSGYARLIDEQTLRSKKFLNIHYALLPRFRGMHPVVWGILNDEEFLGWTLHEMDAGMDSGPVIYQYKSPNVPDKTSVDYMHEFHETVTEQIGPVLLDYIAGTVGSVPQSSEGIVWGVKRNLDDCRIDFSWDIGFLGRIFRALVEPYPLPFVEHKGKKLFVKKHELYSAAADVITRGRVCNIDSRGAWVKVSGGYLVLKEIVDENGNNVPVDVAFKIGSRL